MSTADLRLVLLLILLVFTSAVFAACNDVPVAPDDLSISGAKGGVPGPPPGKGGDKGGQVAGNFSLRFDGTQGTETPDSDDLDLTSTFTIEGWIKPTSPAGLGDQGIISKWGLSVSASYIVVFENDGRLRLVTHDRTLDPDNTKLYSVQPLSAAVWQHFAFVFDDGEATFYLNGAFNNSRTGMNTPSVTTSLVSLGRENSPEGFIGKLYRGAIDEVRIWNVVRSAKKIDQNYDKEISPKSKGLVAYWQMNEGRARCSWMRPGTGTTCSLVIRRMQMLPIRLGR